MDNSRSCLNGVQAGLKRQAMVAMLLRGDGADFRQTQA